MKRIKITLMAVAVTLGVIGSVATFAASHKTATGAGLYWFTTANSYIDQNTVSDEQSASGCDGSAALCEKGYTQSQLNNPADPSQGVKTSQLNMFTPINQE